jgi:hypothetical protein
MEARRVDRDAAKSVAGIARQRAFPEQIDCGVLTTRIPHGCVAGDAWPSQSSPPTSTPLIPFGLLTAAVLIIFASLWKVAGESSLHLSMHRERVY